MKATVLCESCKRVVPVMPGMVDVPCAHPTNRKFMSAMEMVPGEPCTPKESVALAHQLVEYEWSEELGGGIVTSLEPGEDEWPALPDPDKFVDLDGKTRHEGVSW